jgi:endoglucanase
MSRFPIAAAFLAALALAACSKDPSSLVGPSSASGGSGAGAGSGSSGTGGAGTGSGGSGGGGANPAIQPIDTTVFAPSGTGSAANTGGTTSLSFATSGTAQLGNGTCGASGVWTDSLGNVSGPNNPNCIAYYSDGRVGNNHKGECTTSSKGYPGLWLNPQLHPTQPYQTNCLVLGTTTFAVVMSFPASATLYSANDGSGQQVLDFNQGASTVAQLAYHGAANDYTTGAGVLTGTDNTSKSWTIDFSQSALDWTSGLTNGNLISALTTTGVQVVACQGTNGCSLVTLKLTLTP